MFLCYASQGAFWKSKLRGTVIWRKYFLDLLYSCFPSIDLPKHWLCISNTYLPLHYKAFQFSLMPAWWCILHKWLHVACSIQIIRDMYNESIPSRRVAGIWKYQKANSNSQLTPASLHKYIHATVFLLSKDIKLLLLYQIGGRIGLARFFCKKSSTPKEEGLGEYWPSFHIWRSNLSELNCGRRVKGFIEALKVQGGICWGNVRLPLGASPDLCWRTIKCILFFYHTHTRRWYMPHMITAQSYNWEVVST